MSGTGTASSPLLSIVIPSLDGHRGGLVQRLLDSIERQTYRHYETHLIVGVSPQGKAINQGASQAKGDVLIIIDDDSCLADEHVLQRLVDTLQEDPRIGMAGASIVEDPAQSPFQRRAARQFPRLQTPEVSAITDSDLACHGCCAIALDVFRQIGGEREDIVRGLDPDLRVRLRAAGYRVVLAPHCRIHHPLPADLRALLRTFFRNGYGSAYAQRFAPDSVYETHEQLSDGSFSPRTSLAYRIARFPLRLLRAMATFQFLRLLAYCAYATGYAWGWFTARPLPAQRHEANPQAQH